MPKAYYFLLVSLITSCNYSIPKIQDSISGNQTIEKIPIGTIAGYSTIASAIIAPKCLGCHSSAGGNGGGINLETYPNIIARLPAISSSITSGSMPKNGIQLSAKEKEVFLAWIDAGGPLNAINPLASTPAPAPAPAPTPAPITQIEVMPDASKIDYQMVKTKVLEPRCISCHSNSGGNKAGVNLETYESVFNERNGIKSEVNNGTMPIPTNRPLTSIQKQITLIWLNKGAPENLP